jgi:hypothetical protein
MTEAVFAGEEVEKLPAEKALLFLAALNAMIVKLAEELFVCHRPRDRSDGKREHQ